MANELAGLIFGSIASSIAIGTVIWRIISLKIDRELVILRHNLELKDAQISNLQDVQTLLNHGLEEKFEHFSSRIKSEGAEIAKHLRQIEHFLSKTTVYEPRE